MKRTLFALACVMALACVVAVVALGCSSRSVVESVPVKKGEGVMYDWTAVTCQDNHCYIPVSTVFCSIPEDLLRLFETRAAFEAYLGRQKKEVVPGTWQPQRIVDDNSFFIEGFFVDTRPLSPSPKIEVSGALGSDGQ